MADIDKKIEIEAVDSEAVTQNDSPVISEADIKERERLVKKELLREVLIACACVVAGSAIMFGIMTLCMSFSLPLLWGSLIGMANSVLYWLLLYISKTTVIKMPYIGRMLVLVILVIIGLKFDCFYNWAVLIPLAFTKPLAYAFLIIESRKK